MVILASFAVYAQDCDLESRVGSERKRSHCPSHRCTASTSAARFSSVQRTFAERFVHSVTERPAGLQNIGENMSESDTLADTTPGSHTLLWWFLSPSVAMSAKEEDEELKMTTKEGERGEGTTTTKTERGMEGSSYLNIDGQNDWNCSRTKEHCVGPQMQRARAAVEMQFPYLSSSCFQPCGQCWV